jgi:hypothetical protein
MTSPDNYEYRLIIESSSDLEDELEDTTQDLYKELRDLENISVSRARKVKEPLPGTRGEIGILGEITITFLTSGAAIAAIKALREWMKGRKRSITFEKKGETYKVKAENIDKQEMEKIMDWIEKHKN